MNKSKSLITIHKKEMPKLIAADIEGCITPHDRLAIDLIELQKLRSYCEFAADSNGVFPPLVVNTGRSQDYVELLAQCLGIVNNPEQLPFVIENGCALYHPFTHNTLPLVTPGQLASLDMIRNKLRKCLKDVIFEPKPYMITINPCKGNTIENLFCDVQKKLEKENNIDIFKSPSAVDITPKGVSKLSGIQHIIKVRNIKTDLISAIGDSYADLEVLKLAGKRAYCPHDHVNEKVKDLVAKVSKGKNIINEPPPKLVVTAIERECDIMIVYTRVSDILEA